MTSTALFGLLRIMCWSIRSLVRWQHPNMPRFVTIVLDLGLKSDPNMHRARSGLTECG